jgi:hypothetical protein
MAHREERDAEPVSLTQRAWRVPRECRVSREPGELTRDVIHGDHAWRGGLHLSSACCATTTAGSSGWLPTCTRGKVRVRMLRFGAAQLGGGRNDRGQSVACDRVVR